MSKRKDAFLESASPYGFDLPMLMRVYDGFIRLQSATYFDRQVIDYEQGRMFYDLHFYRGEDKIPLLKGYEATLRAIPPIKHTICNGIDTAKLERDLQAVNWLESGPYQTLSPRALTVLGRAWRKMEALKDGGSSIAIDIAQQLQMKYWADTVAQRYTLLDLSTKRYDRHFSFNLNGEHKGLDVRSAYNLLCCRPVYRTGLIGDQPHQAYWYQLSRIAAPDPYRSFDENKIPDFDLFELLALLPLKDASLTANQTFIADQLRVGNDPSVIVLDSGTELGARLSLDVRNKSFILHSAESDKTIPFSRLNKIQKNANNCSLKHSKSINRGIK